MTMRTAFIMASFGIGGLQVASAQVLTIDDSLSGLGTVDVATGAVHYIGTMGFDTITDIAYSPTGALYGVSFTSLYSINPSTAAKTLIGVVGNAANSLVFGTDGTLYMGDGSELYSVNTTNATKTDLGYMGFSSAGDLAFNGGHLYLSSTTDQLIRIDFGAGGITGTAVGSFGFSNVYGLATASNGVLYGVSGTNIFSVNTATGQGTLVRDYSGHGLTAAYGTSFSTEAVPEPNSTLAILVGLGGLLVAARRRSGALTRVA